MSQLRVDPLFAAGTLVYVLDLSPSGSGSQINLETLLGTTSANKLVASDGWHTFSKNASSKTLFSCIDLCQTKPFPTHDLLFLESNDYIAISFKIDYNAVNLKAHFFLRVYLVPQDSAGMQGKIQRRSPQKVVKPALKILPSLLHTVCRCKDSWRASGCPTGLHCKPMEIIIKSNPKDYQSLLDIFNDLSSSDFGEASDSPFLRTKLYTYQQQSVAAMQCMEQARYVPDPLFVPVMGMDEVVFFLQPSTFELRKEQQLIARGRGGFLSEELGSGKTLMILALIISDLNVLPPPPDDLLTTSKILTPLSLHHFPFPHCQESRMLLSLSGFARQSASGHIPSLVELCLDYIRTSKDGYDLQQICSFRASSDSRNSYTLEENLEQLSLLKPFLHNTPFFLQSMSINDGDSRTRRPNHQAPRVIYLSSATVIVVPTNLISQWEGQIFLHCSRNLRVLVVKGDARLPSPQELASNYDIILIASAWLSKVSHSEKLKSQPHYSCKCPRYSKSIRVPICHCHSKAPPLSPLLQVMFKRLVRDEGHNTAAVTDLNLFCEDILAHSRWIVTGTPTVNLLGLNLGTVHEEAPTPSLSESPMLNQNQPTGQELLSALQSEDLPSFGNSAEFFDDHPDSGEEPKSPETGTSISPPAELEDQGCPARVWSNNERADLKTLGSMLGGYLMVERFSSTGDFEKLVIDPLFPQPQVMEDRKRLRGCPLLGAIQVVHQVLKMYMVRHLVKEIEAEHPLPPMSQETVLLEIHSYAAMTFNVIQSTIVVNSVDSEQTDKDYLFHPDNRAALYETMANLSQALFWHRDEEFFDDQLQEKLRNAAGAVERATKRGQTGEIIKVTQEAFAHLKAAYTDATFRAMHHLLEVPYDIAGLPPTIKPALDSVARVHDGEIRQSELMLDENIPCLIAPSHAIELRDAVERQPLMPSKNLVELAKLVHGGERRRNALLAAKSLKRATKKKMSKNAGDAATAEELAGRTKQQEKVLEEMMKEDEIAQARRKELTGGGAVVAAPTHPQSYEGENTRHQFLRASPLGSARILGSLSSKLNYILKEIQEFSSTEKFLIFSTQPLNLVHIAEGLDLLGIKYLDYRSRPTKERGLNVQNLMTFETSDTFRVFLMELRHGARGLNIISASRVIFCEPVWKPDVESQAIKRAHRIGQTKPVTVKTLAIKSTFEEFMLQRRRELKNNDSGKLRGSMADESGMQHYLKNPTFIKAGTQPEFILDVPLLRIPSASANSTQASAPGGSQSTVEPQAANVEIEGSPRTKKVRLIVRSPDDYSEGSSVKKVRFG